MTDGGGHNLKHSVVSGQLCQLFNFTDVTACEDPAIFPVENQLLDFKFNSFSSVILFDCCDLFKVLAKNFIRVIENFL